MKNRIINVQDVPISISQQELDDYICITDIAKAKTGESRSADVVKNWLRNRNTLEFLGTWEMIYNPDFKVVEYEQHCDPGRGGGLRTGVRVLSGAVVAVHPPVQKGDHGDNESRRLAVPVQWLRLGVVLLSAGLSGP